MNYYYPLLCVLLLVSSCTTNTENKEARKIDIVKQARTKDNNDWTFEKTFGSVLKFINEKEYNTNLFELKYIGQIQNGEKAPFLIFAGRECDECDANVSIYIHSPSNGLLNVENGENSYQYPGEERDFENDSLLYKSRAFYGQVLPNINGIIWYQNQLMENNSWQKSVFLIDVDQSGKIDSVLKDFGQLKQTLDLLKKGLCTEIKGLKYTSEP